MPSAQYAAWRGDKPDKPPYRGWMLVLADYRRLYDALHKRGVELVNDPDAYRRGHHFPASYPAIEGMTPRSAWLPVDRLDIDAAVDLVATFGDRPVIIKDYVKSRKHEWAEACFIPHARDRQAARRVVENFIER